TATTAIATLNVEPSNVNILKNKIAGTRAKPRIINPTDSKQTRVTRARGCIHPLQCSSIADDRKGNENDRGRRAAVNSVAISVPEATESKHSCWGQNDRVIVARTRHATGFIEDVWGC